MRTDVPPTPGASPPGEAERRETAELEQLIERLSEVVEALQRLFEVRVARARVELRERTFRALGWLLLAGVLVTLAVSGTVYAMRGLAGLLGGVAGPPWAGDLLAGVGGFAAMLLIGLAARGRLRRRGLRRVRKEFTESS